jgi:hypothetical protein
MSGLKINVTKSEVVVINGDDKMAKEYAEIFNRQIGSFTVKYLGVPMSPNRLKVQDWTCDILAQGLI